MSANFRNFLIYYTVLDKEEIDALAPCEMVWTAQLSSGRTINQELLKQVLGPYHYQHKKTDSRNHD